MSVAKEATGKFIKELVINQANYIKIQASYEIFLANYLKKL